jgi:hypothetical protein
VKRPIVLILATCRLTRFITTDWLGEWTICIPLRRWANGKELPLPNPQGWRVPLSVSDQAQVDEMVRGPVEPANGWRSKLVSGLDCSFCVGFWVGLTAIVVDIMPLPAPLRWLRARLLEALALNYVTAHISKRID